MEIHLEIRNVALLFLVLSNCLGQCSTYIYIMDEKIEISNVLSDRAFYHLCANLFLRRDSNLNFLLRIATLNNISPLRQKIYEKL